MAPSWAAYVGVAGDLKERVTQHLIKRDSSVTTQTAAVGLNPEYVREIEWWEHETFSDRVQLEAAELVAFDVFEPALRSRARPAATALNFYADEAFGKRMHQLLEGSPTGRLSLPSLPALMQRVIELEDRVASLEATDKG